MGAANDFGGEGNSLLGYVRMNTLQSGYQSEGPPAAVVRKVHYMLHNIDMIISKLEARG